MKVYVPRAGSHVERAVDYLRENGMTATAPLAEAIEVDSGQIYPLFEAAIRHGVVAKTKRDGLVWYSVGDGKPLERDQDDEPLTPAHSRPRPPLTDGLAIDKILHTAKTTADRPFVCGLFSDGRLVLELPGQTVTLDKAQTDVLVALLDRLAA